MSHRTPSRREAPPEPEWDEEEEEDVVHTRSVIDAHSLFRILLILLTIWTVFEGVALATGAFSAVDAGTDRTAERMLGGLMIVFGGIYAMLAWRRGQYRLLLWVPFAVQLAIVVPLLLSFDGDRVLLLVISSAFLVLMLYVWWQSRDIEDPYDDYGEGEEEEDEEEDEEDADAELEEYADGEDEEEPPPPKRAPSSSTPPPTQRAGRFRKRDG